MSRNIKSSASFQKSLRSLKNRFLKHTGDINVYDLTAKDCNDFLYMVTEDLENTTFNTYKKQLSVLIKGLVKDGYLNDNYVKDISLLKENPQKNKSYTAEQLTDIYSKLESIPNLEFFFMHVHYALLRQSSALRLKVKHVNMKTMRFDLDTKTGRGNEYTRNIPTILYNRYKELDIDCQDPEAYVFGRNGFFEHWDIKLSSKDTYYGELFKPIKEDVIKVDSHLYGIKSVRHNGFGMIYTNVLKELNEKGELLPKEKALEYVRKIAKHKNTEVTEKYLRGHNFIEDVNFDKYISQ